MAPRYTSANSEYSKVTAGLPAGSADWTAMAWVYITSIGAGQYQCALGFWYSGNREGEVYFDGDSSNHLSLYGGGAAGGTHALSAGTWYHITAVKSGATMTAYLNGVSEVTIASWPNSGTFSEFTLASYNSGAADFFNGRICFVKTWSAALTLAEIQQEMYTVLPRRFFDLWSCWPGLPGAERAYDLSGLVHDLSEVNTPTDEDPPPISWGARRFWAPPAGFVPEAPGYPVWADFSRFPRRFIRKDRT